MHEILQTLRSPDSLSRLQPARESAGNDMLKHMQLVFPLTAQIQMEVIPKYGFKGDGEGTQRLACSHIMNVKDFAYFYGYF